MTNEKSLSVLLLLLLTLLILSVPNSSAEKHADDSSRPAWKPKADEPYKAVNEFCNQRRNRTDREFCLRALKSDPRSASAKNNTGLLYISVDLSLVRTNKTRKFLADMAKKGAPKPPLKRALKDCVSAYDVGLLELKIIPKEMEDDPGLASYDALMASDALQSCKDSLERHRIADYSISRRHRMDTQFVELCVAIAMTFG